MKTALISGGAGFIGSHLCSALLKNNISVVCADNYSTGRQKNISDLFEKPNFLFVEADVINPLPPLKKKIDYLFHLASPASPNHHSTVSYHALAEETMLVNTVGTYNLLKTAEEHKARFLFASTSEVYGDPEVHPQKETYNGNVSTTGPRSVYDEAKRFGETLVSFFSREKGIDTRIARIFNTYGPHMRADDQRMIINFIVQASQNKPITVYGDGKQTRSLCYVDDMVDALMSFMFKDDLSSEIINIGSTDEQTVYEYARLVKELMNSSSEIIFSEKLPEDDPLQRRPDISKAETLLHWSPATDIKEGLKKTIDYFKDEIS